MVRHFFLVSSSFGSVIIRDEIGRVTDKKLLIILTPSNTDKIK